MLEHVQTLAQRPDKIAIRRTHIMLEWLRFWPSSLPETTSRLLDYGPPEYIRIVGQEDFQLAPYVQLDDGLPRMDWAAALDRMEEIEGTAERDRFWTDCERAWLLHLGRALGSEYKLYEDGEALMLSLAVVAE